MTLAYQKLIDSIVKGNEDSAAEETQGLLNGGAEPMQIINGGLIPGMAIVSEKYEKKEYYLPQMMLSADAFYAAFVLLKPLISADQIGGKGTIMIGVVEGDIHDIGKNLVKTVLEANGFSIIDMGRDVPIEDYVDKVRELKPDILMLSTLMTPTMVNMQRVIDGLKEEGVREKVKVIIGGGPVSLPFAHKIGADNYADNEKEAVKLASQASAARG